MIFKKNDLANIFKKLSEIMLRLKNPDMCPQVKKSRPQNLPCRQKSCLVSTFFL